MSTQTERAAQFASLHVKGDPVILYNIWDAGGAIALQEIGAKAVATGSVAVAMANGSQDGENFPLDLVMANLARIVSSVDLPVSADLESGYGRPPEIAAETAARAMSVGVVGMNFEDQIIGGSGLYPIEEQSARIAAISAAAHRAGIAFFINARSDVFLKEPDPTQHAALLDETVRRAEAYAAAGASSFFAPGLRDVGLIRSLCERSPLPVNITGRPGELTPKILAGLGVARVSYGGQAYRATVAAFKEAAKREIEGG